MTKIAPWIVIGLVLTQAAAQAAGPASTRPAPAIAPMSAGSPASSAPASSPAGFKTETRILPPVSAEEGDGELLEGIGIVVSLVPTGEGKMAVSVNGAKGPALDEVDQASLMVSEDDKHVAYVARDAGRSFVVLDGNAGAAYERIDANTLVAADDLSRLAFAAFRGGKWAVVVGGNEGPLLGGIAGRIHLSPDGNALAYVAVQDGRQTLMLNHKPVGGAHDQVLLPSERPFSDDSRRTACVVRDGRRCRVLLDGNEQADFDEIDPDWIQFSRDGRRVAYVGQKGTSYHVVLDGREQDAYPGSPMNMVFSPDGNRLAYIAPLGNGKEEDLDLVVVVDGKAGEVNKDEITALVFSPDGRHVAYSVKKDGKSAVVFDGQCGPLYDALRDSVDHSQDPPNGPVAGIAFSADSKHWAYAAAKGDKYVQVVDGKEVLEAVGLDCLRFSPDGSRRAYAYSKEGRWIVVADGNEVGRHDQAESILFSPDSRRLAYVARDAGRWRLIVDGNEGTAFNGAVWSVVFSPDSRHFACMVSKKDGDHTACMVVLNHQATRWFDQIATPVHLLFDKNNVLEYQGRDGRERIHVRHVP